MPKVLKPDEPYSSRRLDATVINTTLDSEAVDLLHRYSGTGRKNTGRFLARLLYEHHARKQEEKRIREECMGALAEEAV